jgi:hypothetical protein
MAEDYTALVSPYRTKTFALGLSDVATEIKLPKWSRRISFRFETNAGKYSSEGTDGAAIDADFQTVAAGILHSIATDRTGRAGIDTDEVSIFLASTTASTVVRLTIESGAA